jgi:hypothetical protein
MPTELLCSMFLRPHHVQQHSNRETFWGIGNIRHFSFKSACKDMEIKYIQTPSHIFIDRFGFRAEHHRLSWLKFRDFLVCSWEYQYSALRQASIPPTSSRRFPTFYNSSHVWTECNIFAKHAWKLFKENIFNFETFPTHRLGTADVGDYRIVSFQRSPYIYPLRLIQHFKIIYEQTLHSQSYNTSCNWYYIVLGSVLSSQFQGHN